MHAALDSAVKELPLNPPHATLTHSPLAVSVHQHQIENMGKNIEDSGERNAGVHWLAFCALGMVSSLALYGVALEYATSGGRKLHELSFVFVTTTVYAITAGFMKWLFGEPSADIPKKHMLILSFTSLASSWTSVRSLRYVIYPVQVSVKCDV